MRLRDADDSQPIRIVPAGPRGASQPLEQSLVSLADQVDARRLVGQDLHAAMVPWTAARSGDPIVRVPAATYGQGTESESRDHGEKPEGGRRVRDGEDPHVRLIRPGLR